MSDVAQQFDIVIVGQGMAGTLMAYFLSEAGKKILVIDNHFEGSSSMVAAGIVNPITGKNFVLSWRINDFLPVARRVYDEISKKLGIQAYVEANVVRTLATPADENIWLSKSAEPITKKYIVEHQDVSEFEGKVQPSFAYGELTHSFHVNWRQILEGFRELWKASGAYLSEKFDHQQLNITTSSYQYRGLSFNEIVFCEGFKGKDNPFFPNVGLTPSKGDVLLVRIQGAPFTKMYKDGIFIVHQYDDVYWAGSDYKWNCESDTPDPEAYEMIYGELKRILKIPFEVIDHIAAIRPTMRSRRPVFKVHETYNGMYFFNGLGTKGSSMGPYLAQQFSNYIIHKNPEDLKI